MDTLTIELEQKKEEVKRLVRNWRSLLDVMPEMVVLIRQDCGIEYMNPSAVSVMGDMVGQLCPQNLCDSYDIDEINKLSANGLGQVELREARVDDIAVEFSIAPFWGYKGDLLLMLVMRDVTRRKVQELELQKFHKNIEEVLHQKIEELKEREKIHSALAREVNHLKKKISARDQTDEMIGSSRQMRELREIISQVAETDATVLVAGESGTGKELVADLIRSSSDRKDKPYLKVNCNTINDNLLESDLFGYEKGAFTGAAARKKGKFEVVNGGTIFLDEIGDISPRMQAALLRVLQNGEVVRVGGSKPVFVDVRVVAATHVDLVKAVDRGKFRLDLFYRLNIINVVIPPLRDRKEDIVDLATHFVRHYRAAFKKEIDYLPDTIINKLLLHNWPGNVRELENVIQRAVLTAKNNVIAEHDLVIEEKMSASALDDYLGELEAHMVESSLRDMMAEFEGEVVYKCLCQCDGNVQDAARMLQIGKTALYDRIKRYGLAKRAGW